MNTNFVDSSTPSLCIQERNTSTALMHCAKLSKWPKLISICLYPGFHSAHSDFEHNLTAHQNQRKNGSKRKFNKFLLSPELIYSELFPIKFFVVPCLVCFVGLDPLCVRPHTQRIQSHLMRWRWYSIFQQTIRPPTCKTFPTFSLCVV